MISLPDKTDSELADLYAELVERWGGRWRLRVRREVNARLDTAVLSVLITHESETGSLESVEVQPENMYELRQAAENMVPTRVKREVWQREALLAFVKRGEVCP